MGGHWSHPPPLPRDPVLGLSPQASLLPQPGVSWGLLWTYPSLSLSPEPSLAVSEDWESGGVCRRRTHLGFVSHEGLREARILEASAVAVSRVERPLPLPSPPPSLPLPLPSPSLHLRCLQGSGLFFFFLSLCHVACGILVP